MTDKGGTGEKQYISDNQESLYLNSSTADVNFIFKNDNRIQKVPAHKHILAAGSPVFEKMFFSLLRESGDVGIVDADIDMFQTFLKVFYLREFTIETMKPIITMDNMEDIAALIDKYNAFDNLNKFLISLIGKISNVNLCWGYQLAVIIEHEPFKRHCEKGIAVFARDIFASDEFLRVNQNVLSHILRLDHLICDETDVLTACIRWAKFKCTEIGLDANDPKMLKTQLGECFYLIRFTSMALKLFVRSTESYKEMFTQEDFIHILYKTSPTIAPNKFNLNPRAFQWKDGEVVFFDCGKKYEDLYDDGLHVQFTVNEPLLLVEFRCWFVANKEEYDLNFDVTIAELQSESHESVRRKSKTLLFKESTSIEDNGFHLPQPILLRPKTTYDVQLVKIHSDDKYSYKTENHLFGDYEGFEDERILDGKAIFKFSGQRDLIHCLGFNKLDFPSED